MLFLRFVLIVLLFSSIGCSEHHDHLAVVDGETHDHERRVDYRFSSSVYPAFVPIPEEHNEQQERADLGRKLFHDPLLSSDKTVACASCHIIQHGGDDGLVRSLGVKGQSGKVNAPTVLNASLNAKQFWDGRANSLEEQIDGPIHASFEMNSNWPLIVERLSEDSAYVAEFKNAFSDGLTKENVAAAIVSFERTLLTPFSRFDAFIQGDESALTEQEHLGFTAFNDLGCVSCHQGVNLGANVYQRMGLVHSYYENKTVLEADQGLYALTGREEDRHKFRVPSLRNVARTAPYFHDGSSPELSDAVTKMAYYQLGTTLPQETVEQIVAFLTTLNAEPLTTVEARHEDHDEDQDERHDGHDHHQEDAHHHSSVSDLSSASVIAKNHSVQSQEITR